MKPVELQLRRLIRETLSDLSSDGESFDQYSGFMRDVKQGQAKIFALSSPLTLVHRSNNMDLTLNDLDPLAIRQTKQGKRNSAPKVGLYAYSIEHDVPRYGDNKLTIVMPAGSKVLDLTELPRGKSSRIDIDAAHKLVKDGIDLITGFDLIGPQEWVILKKPDSLVNEEIVRQSSLDDENLKALQKYVDAADNHPEFAGYNLVKGADKDSARFAILDNTGRVVGFMTPRFDRGYWRTGAIYTDPRVRGQGHARKAIIEFFSDPAHRPARVWIASMNKESQKAFTGAGFVKGERKDLSSDPHDIGHNYYLE